VILAAFVQASTFLRVWCRFVDCPITVPISQEDRTRSLVHIANVTLLSLGSGSNSGSRDVSTDDICASLLSTVPIHLRALWTPSLSSNRDSKLKLAIYR
jgi:hypothetical protein